MAKDPQYLEKLGELATLKNAIACWYHQDGFEVFKSHEEIWRDIRRCHDPESLELLLAQVQTLLSRTDSEINEVWVSQSSFGFYNEADGRAFFVRFAAFLGAPPDV